MAYWSFLKIALGPEQVAAEIAKFKLTPEERELCKPVFPRKGSGSYALGPKWVLTSDDLKTNTVAGTIKPIKDPASTPSKYHSFLGSGSIGKVYGQDDDETIKKFSNPLAWGMDEDDIWPYFKKALKEFTVFVAFYADASTLKKPFRFATDFACPDATRMTMRKMSAVTLERYKETFTGSFQERAIIFCNILGAVYRDLTRLHSLGARHNDVQMGNIIGNGAEWHLIDFGEIEFCTEFDDDFAQLLLMLFNMLSWVTQGLPQLLVNDYAQAASIVIQNVGRSPIESIIVRLNEIFDTCLAKLAPLNASSAEKVEVVTESDFDPDPNLDPYIWQPTNYLTDDEEEFPAVSRSRDAYDSWGDDDFPSSSSWGRSRSDSTSSW